MYHEMDCIGNCTGNKNCCMECTSCHYSSRDHVDVNECEEGKCDQNSICNNTVGSFECVCKTGFTGTGLECEGIVAWF